MRPPSPPPVSATATRLGELKDVLVRFRELFSSVHTLVDMRTFYDIYRPLLGGA